MSLRFALLGLLADAPGSGYDLSRRFEDSLQQYAWHAKHSQIYPELTKLADDGLAKVVAEGARGRRTYAITEQGRADLLEWLRTPPDHRSVRSEPVLRMFLLSTMPTDEARLLLKELATEADRELIELTEQVRLGDEQSGGDVMAFGRLAAEYGMRQLAVARDWAQWAIANLPD